MRENSTNTFFQNHEKKKCLRRLQKLICVYFFQSCFFFFLQRCDPIRICAHAEHDFGNVENMVRPVI